MSWEASFVNSTEATAQPRPRAKGRTKKQGCKSLALSSGSGAKL
eukprot:CAMPEP_0184740076 /NCGR_PEP_ID=MMETSP0315-20130426/3053_1 /TAXON_ID=101924 /ORGANISM="Rhodosorus marinus, Strain UTEX LB 2760" /LENGTH=43 /DNA_ID= /DNA_START= /DNA_END= /DNA_ORIENTATION=